MCGMVWWHCPTFARLLGSFSWQLFELQKQGGTAVFEAVRTYKIEDVHWFKTRRMMCLHVFATAHSPLVSPSLQLGICTDSLTPPDIGLTATGSDGVRCLHRPDPHFADGGAHFWTDLLHHGCPAPAGTPLAARTKKRTQETRQYGPVR